MYCDIDFKSKKELIEAFKNGTELSVYQPGGLFEGKKDGVVSIEGPHYPKPHKWYCRVEITNGIIVRVLK